MIGRTLVPLLVAGGHEVTAMTRSIDGGALLRSLGAQPVMADALDRDSVLEAVVRARPDAIIHQLTDLRAGNGAANAALRIEGTRNLVDAAHAAGVERVIAQSLAWAYAPGDEPADEQVSLDVAAADPRSTTVRGVTALELRCARGPLSGSSCATACSTVRGRGTPRTDFVRMRRERATSSQTKTSRASSRSETQRSPRRRRSTGPPGPSTYATTTLLRVSSGCRSSARRSTLPRLQSLALVGRRGRVAQTTLARAKSLGGHRAMPPGASGFRSRTRPPAVLSSLQPDPHEAVTEN